MTAYMPVSVIVILIGFGLLGCSAYAYFRQRLRVARSLLTTGVVIEMVRQSTTGEYLWSRTEDGIKVRKKYLYRPVIRFETQTGGTVEFMLRIASRPAPYEVGESVGVIYDPQNPPQAQISWFVNLWFYALMLLLFGLFTLGMGLLGVILK